MHQKLGPFLVFLAMGWWAFVQGPLLFYGSTTAKREAQSRIASGESLVVLEMTWEDFRKSLLPGNELLVDGTMHDVVTVSEKDGLVTVRAFRDDRETFLAKRLRKLFQRRPEPQGDFPSWAQSWFAAKFLAPSEAIWDISREVLALISPESGPSPRVKGPCLAVDELPPAFLG
jgi:hypothetical protein